MSICCINGRLGKVSDYLPSSRSYSLSPIKSSSFSSSKSTFMRSHVGDHDITSDSDTEVEDITVVLRAEAVGKENYSRSLSQMPDDWGKIEQNLYKVLSKYSENDRKAVMDQFKYIEHRVGEIIKDCKAQVAAKDEETKQLFVTQADFGSDKADCDDHMEAIERKLRRAVSTIESLTKLCSKTDRCAEGVIDFLINKLSMRDDLILDMKFFTSMKGANMPLSIQTSAKLNELLNILWPYAKTRLLLRRREAPQTSYLQKFTHPLL
mmetsp:Transcript_21543/g.39398  ORF Transcript_21543/g.39398 Transcript_21543/m.39398 type:complete len:265 (+) Transcript_21543:682-1476(+)